jgi:hypothetical protein
MAALRPYHNVESQLLALHFSLISFSFPIGELNSSSPTLDPRVNHAHGYAEIFC